MQTPISEKMARKNPIAVVFMAALNTENTISVLIWCSLTEPAKLVSYLVSQKWTNIMDRLHFIANWKTPLFIKEQLKSAMMQATAEKMRMYVIISKPRQNLVLFDTKNAAP